MQPDPLEAILLAVFLVVLAISANVAVEAISRFSKSVGISELSAGLVIVSVSTSIPETTVAIFSATSGNMGITLGDVFGSNVTDIGLVAAILLLLSPIKRIENRHNSIALSRQLLLASTIPFLLLAVRTGTRVIGALLLVAFAYFVYHNLKKDRDGTKEEAVGSPFKQIALFLVMIGIVIVSARIVVESASAIASSTGLRGSIIGASIVALGTSLPELSVDSIAAKKGHLGLALGDIIGSCVANMTLVLGTALSLSAVTTDFRILSELISFSIVAPIILFVFIRRGKVSRWNSIVLLIVYASFLFTMYGTQFELGPTTP